MLSIGSASLKGSNLLLLILKRLCGVANFLDSFVWRVWTDYVSFEPVRLEKFIFVVDSEDTDWATSNKVGGTHYTFLVVFCLLIAVAKLLLRSYASPL